MSDVIGDFIGSLNLWTKCYAFTICNVILFYGT